MNIFWWNILEFRTDELPNAILRIDYRYVRLKAFSFAKTPNNGVRK